MPRPISLLAGGRVAVRASALVVRLTIEDERWEDHREAATAGLGWGDALALYRQLGDALREQQKREARLHPEARVLEHARRVAE